MLGKGSRDMKIQALDHLVLTVRSIEETCRFYGEGLGMEVEQFDGGRWALKFGNQKFNLHQAGQEFEPKAENPAPGSQDFCLLVENLQDCQKQLETRGLKIIVGPVDRTGACGPLRSIYLRDPDANLVELAEQLPQ